MLRPRQFQGEPDIREELAYEMKMSRRKASVPNPQSSRLPRLLSLVLVIGIAAFGVFYYQDQRVDPGPTMIDRQTLVAETAVRKTPNNLAARMALAASYNAVKRYDDALAQYKEILKADKGNRSALLGRGSALTALGDLKGASLAYRKITGVSQKGEFAGADPQLQEAHYYLGSIALKQNKTQEAITELEAALKIQRTDSDALYLLGVARLKDGAPKLAIAAFKQAILFVPTGWCEPYSQLALAHGKLGQVSEATYSGAMADFCLKRPAEATRKLKTLIPGPLAINALMGLGLIAETGSSHAEAVSWYKKVLGSDRTNVGAIAALSRLGVAPSLGKASSTPKAADSSITQGPS